MTAPPPSGDALPRVTPVSPFFKLVFLVIVSLTIALLGVNVALALFVDNPNDATKDVIASCSNLSKAGFGAIFGLVGGKLA
ncbi:hypothetical protein [Mycobacterium sp. GA-2829]|uniref:hypothetical protein n=1 Tax=Mycobacterium sp. GA-2829 TaxID=1772283 RepID=UPI000A5BEB5F|nr:hypothetical protein [Mycobacterium sp. GA-2829]